MTPPTPSRDIDLAARGFANETSEVEERVGSVLAVLRDDGLGFDLDSTRGAGSRRQRDRSSVGRSIWILADSRPRNHR